MGVLSRDKKQVNLIYAGSSQTGKKLKAYLESFKKAALATDIEKSMPSKTQWAEFAKELDVSIKTFIDEKAIDQIDDYSEYSETDWIKVIEQNPSSLKGALVVNGDRTEHIIGTTELFKYFDVDSAGLDKTFHNENPTTKKTTNKDNFI